MEKGMVKEHTPTLMEISMWGVGRMESLGMEQDLK
jgi:hypothetical protein